MRNAMNMIIKNKNNLELINSHAYDANTNWYGIWNSSSVDETNQV